MPNELERTTDDVGRLRAERVEFVRLQAAHDGYDIRPHLGVAALVDVDHGRVFA